MINIQIVQPHFNIPDDEQASELDRFWAGIAADPLTVVIVEPVREDPERLVMETAGVAIFSDYDRAMAYAQSLTCAGAVIIPKRIDEPSWGNVEVN